MEIKIENNKATLCCGKEKCPTIEIMEGHQGAIARIKDDFGNTVWLNPDQAALIPEAIKKLNE